MYKWLMKIMPLMLILSFLGISGCSGKYQIFHMSLGGEGWEVAKLTADAQWKITSPIADKFVTGLLEGPPAPTAADRAAEIKAVVEALSGDG